MKDGSSGGFRSASRLIVFSAFAIIVSWCALACLPGSTGDGDLRASVLQEAGAPVAVIYPMDDRVSNGTTYTLSGVGSYDTDGGTIVAYHWEVEFENQTQHLYQPSHPYVFEEIGLYKIKLTVTDDSGKTGVNFTAVYSVPDKDLDGMADWWEAKYFDGLSVTPGGDVDGDGYTNLEEYLRGTNPLVDDPPEGMLEQNWEWFLAAAVAIVVVLVATYPMRRRKKKAAERKKMELAIEIQKALDEE